MLSNSKCLGGIIEFEDYFAVQAAKKNKAILTRTVTRERPLSITPRTYWAAFSFARNAERYIGALPAPPARSFGVVQTKWNTEKAFAGIRPLFRRMIWNTPSEKCWISRIWFAGYEWKSEVHPHCFRWKPDAGVYWAGIHENGPVEATVYLV